MITLSRGRCGLSRCITYYLVAIAVSDFLVIITTVILNRIGRIYFRNSVLSTTPGCAVSIMLGFATRDGSVWLTVAFTIDRFIAICCQSLKTRYCTEKTALLVTGLICAISCVKNAPLYFVCRPLYIVDGVPWFCDRRPTYFTMPAWKAYDWLDRILTPFFPFFFILLLNVLTVRHILAASRARKRLRGAASHGDSELANRKRSIILLFAIALSFLLLWTTHVVHFFYVRIKGKGYFNSSDFSDPQYILQETGNMLQLVSSCNNVFIYAVAQTKFREELKSVLMWPFTGCVKRQQYTL
ncbi:G-protein coupled receptor 15-like [Scyliorhinus torazame]|uniref:G-protein coupled receptor 15-like n=1 Tax=Scyliorhinus torazame TaxID=75743 RepID=UPI003B5B778E